MEIQKIYLIILSSMLLVGSIWQIEYIITCAQNGWIYDFSFHLFQCDIWFAHDIWYFAIFISFILMVYALSKK